MCEEKETMQQDAGTIFSYYVEDGAAVINNLDEEWVENVTEVVIPQRIDGYPVKAIGPYVFSDCSRLEWIQIPDTVHTIEAYAFQNCSSLTRVRLPKSLKVLEWNVFDGCSSMEQILIPDTVSFVHRAQHIESEEMLTVILYRNPDENSGDLPQLVADLAQWNNRLRVQDESGNLLYGSSWEVGKLREEYRCLAPRGVQPMQYHWDSPRWVKDQLILRLFYEGVEEPVYSHYVETIELVQSPMDRCCRTYYDEKGKLRKYFYRTRGWCIPGIPFGYLEADSDRVSEEVFERAMTMRLYDSDEREIRTLIVQGGRSDDQVKVIRHEYFTQDGVEMVRLLVDHYYLAFTKVWESFADGAPKTTEDLKKDERFRWYATERVQPATQNIVENIL